MENKCNIANKAHSGSKDHMPVACRGKKVFFQLEGMNIHHSDLSEPVFFQFLPSHRWTTVAKLDLKKTFVLRSATRGTNNAEAIHTHTCTRP